MRHRIILHAAILSIAAFVAVSCEKIDSPYVVQKGSTGPVITSATPKVLLEEFTGHRCVNCPSGHAEAKAIMALHPDSVIVISIHSGYFAEPQSSGDFTADYRTEAGNTITNEFAVDSYPSGLINRTRFNQTYLQSYPSWQEYVASELQRTALAAITLKTEWDNTARKVTIKPTVSFIEDATGIYNLCVVITEDSICSPQKNDNDQIGATPVIESYYHMHVLRGAVNGAWGESLKEENDIASGSTFSKSYTFVLPQSWNEKQCSVVAYVSRMDDSSEKYSVIQVEEAHVVPSK